MQRLINFIAIIQLFTYIIRFGGEVYFGGTGFNTAIHVPVSSRSYVSLGLSPRILNNQVDLSDIIVRNAAADQAYQSLLLNGASNTYFNLNSGISFHSNKFLIAYGIDKLASALVSGNEAFAIDNQLF